MGRKHIGEFILAVNCIGVEGRVAKEEKATE